MMTIDTAPGVGGWSCPCAHFDYTQFVRDAQQECEQIQVKLHQLKAERPRTAEQELRRRRRVRILTDMYYEQRGNLLGLAEKITEKGQVKEYE